MGATWEGDGFFRRFGSPSEATGLSRLVPWSDTLVATAARVFRPTLRKKPGRCKRFLSLVAAAAMGIALIPSSVPNLCSDGACTSLVMLTIEFD
jgi:hypothetical protein